MNANRSSNEEMDIGDIKLASDMDERVINDLLLIAFDLMLSSLSKFSV